MKQKICQKTNKRGFTLIELLVVIGILALLLAITLIAINPAKQFAQANDTKRSSDVNAILNALNQYAADNRGQLPAGIGASAVSIGSSGVNLCADLVTEYLAALPTDPTSGNTAGEVGAPVTVCTAAYDTGYVVSRSADNNRLTVTATSEVNPTIPISVTR
ncbi:MAG: type II secretion system protein [Candidatus Shapirobacteria bacterium]|jgi:type IV pilus assembly protein PilA